MQFSWLVLSLSSSFGIIDQKVSDWIVSMSIWVTSSR
jgi:hypothetical protein